MEFLGICEAQYASNLLSSKRIVLRTDRDRGDNPFMEFYYLSQIQKLRIRICNTVYIEDMKSDPSLGAKDRIDIHFNEVQLDAIISILTPFINSLSITFDDAPRSTPDPTGTEYPGGMSLGEIKNITLIPAILRANYANRNFFVEATGIYADAEKYIRGNKYHLGARINKKSMGIIDIIDDINSFELLIEYSQLKRFLHSMNVAKMWFA